MWRIRRRCFANSDQNQTWDWFLRLLLVLIGIWYCLWPNAHFDEQFKYSQLLMELIFELTVRLNAKLRRQFLALQPAIASSQETPVINSQSSQNMIMSWPKKVRSYQYIKVIVIITQGHIKVLARRHMSWPRQTKSIYSNIIQSGTILRNLTWKKNEASGQNLGKKRCTKWTA